MVQIISDPSRGSLFGKIGKGFVQGLSETVPKEIERKRLSEGLQALAQQGQDLSPEQFLAKAYSTPGITPEMVRQFGELQRERNIRGMYGKTRRGTEDFQTKAPESPNIKDIQFAGLNQNQPTKRGQHIRSDFANEEEMATAEPGFNDVSPVRPEAVPKGPWPLEKRNEAIARLAEENPNVPLSEIRNMASDMEARDLAQPTAEQAKDVFFEEQKNKADDEFTKQLETKLQKKGDLTYNDLPGTLQLGLRKGMYKDIVKGMSREKAADKWTEIGLNQAKANVSLNKLANQPFLDALQKETTLNKLMSLQKRYAEAGNQEQFKNELIDKFNASPQGASLIAYPRSPKVKDYLSRFKPSKSQNAKEISRKAAADVEDLIASGDSILAIARDLKDKYGLFDEKSFFDQIREDQASLPLTPAQKAELDEAESSVIRSWGDVWLFPSFGRSKAND